MVAAIISFKVIPTELGWDAERFRSDKAQAVILLNDLKNDRSYEMKIKV